jgi:hypothetical protein
MATSLHCLYVTGSSIYLQSSIAIAMSTEVKDIEIPPTPSPSITDETASCASATSSPPSTPRKRAPSPPRWRFVNEAKSTYGYSSLSAGKYVQGISADELGAKYTPPPDISLYRAKDEEVKVGKLEIDEKAEVQEELPHGEFPGLPAAEEPEVKEPKTFREWDLTYDLPPKLLKDYVWLNGEIDEKYNAVDESFYGKARDVGKLQPRSIEYKEDNLSGQYTLPKNDDDDYWQLAVDSIHSCRGSESEIESESELEIEHETNQDLASLASDEEKPLQDAAPEICSAETTDEVVREEKWYKKKKCRYLWLLLLLLPVIILASVLGRREDDTTKNSAAAAVIPVGVAAALNSTEVPSSTPSASPSAFPSTSSELQTVAPTPECPFDGDILFSLQHSIPSVSTDVGNATWSLRDSCTGEVVLECLPCSMGTLTLGKKNLFGNRHRNMQIEILQGVTKCIPSRREYIFEVSSTNDPDSCCGFDVYSYSLRFNNNLVGNEIQSVDGIDHIFYIGESDEPCTSSSAPSLWPTFDAVTHEPTRAPSQEPTKKPSISPSNLPTRAPVTDQPTKMPITSQPTKRPVTNLPTKSPITFVGGCPEAFVELSYYPIGVQVESNGIVYECIDYSCGTYGFEPGKDDGLWQQGWTVIGPCDGTLTPISKPTMDPVSCTTKKAFNLCFALDNSGSVCSFGVGECLFCEPAIWCQDSLFSPAQPYCCSNYKDVTTFSKLMIFALSQFEAEKSFSVVQFSTYAQLVGNLATADETLTVLDNMHYTGGSTDHAAAISRCQESFAASSDPSRDNFIMIITDGLPSTDDLYPEIEALEEAEAAKSQGTIIIPIFISKFNELNALNFMSLLSSDGDVFDVTEFGSLDTLKESLVEKVSCS